MPRRAATAGRDRQANSALGRIVFTRIASDPAHPGLPHPAHRRGQDHPRTHPCLGRYVARDVYKALSSHTRQLNQDPATQTYSMIT